MFKTLKNDFPASIIVFFVALPLCLGIALASGAPSSSGIIAGIIGGIVVGVLSGSKIGVSGPAAGLVAVVATAIPALGGFEPFLVAVVLAGIMQVGFGLLRLGIIGYFFPNSVIVGMLSGIGILIVISQMPYLLGIPDHAFANAHFSEILQAGFWHELIQQIPPSVFWIGVLGVLFIYVWDHKLRYKHQFFALFQAPLVAVVLAILITVLLEDGSFAIPTDFLVQINASTRLDELKNHLYFPDFSVITRPEVWSTAFALALVASLETLLSVEATDKLDPDKNITPTNRELFAQGTGNIISGLIGGLPITQVIVRSSANIQSNAKTKASTILHGFLLLISVIALPTILNYIPNAILAAILVIVGFHLAKPKLFMVMWRRGWTQFVPFIVTVIIIVATDLLKGIFVGLLLGIAVILIKSYQNSLSISKQTQPNGHKFLIRFADEITFLNKAAIQKELNELPKDCSLVLDLKDTTYIDFDVVEILEDFAVQARIKNIEVTLQLTKKTLQNPTSYYELFSSGHKKMR